MDDPFEIHMQLLGLLKRLTASAASIHNVVGFLVRYQARCADDLWETVLDECHKVNMIFPTLPSSATFD